MELQKCFATLLKFFLGDSPNPGPALPIEWEPLPMWDFNHLKTMATVHTTLKEFLLDDCIDKSRNGRGADGSYKPDLHRYSRHCSSWKPGQAVRGNSTGRHPNRSSDTLRCRPVHDELHSASDPQSSWTAESDYERPTRHGAKQVLTDHPKGCLAPRGAAVSGDDCPYGL